MASSTADDRRASVSRDRRDLDPQRQCMRCGKDGLRYDNKSGLCSDCHLSLPGLLKALGIADLDTTIHRVVSAYVDHYDEARAGQILGIDRRSIYVVLGGGSIIGERAAPRVDLDEVRGLDPSVVQLMMQRYREFEPLDPEWSRVVEPWRTAMRAEIDGEDKIGRRRRVVAIDERAEITCYVPPITAPLDHEALPNAYGRYAPGSPRGALPMRIAVALWALGFGAVRIARIAREVGIHSSPSAVGRVLKQTRRRFDGAEAVLAGPLAAELRTRPLRATCGF